MFYQHYVFLYLFIFYSLEHFVKEPIVARLEHRCVASVLNNMSTFFSLMYLIKVFGWQHNPLLTPFRSGPSVCGICGETGQSIEITSLS